MATEGLDLAPNNSMKLTQKARSLSQPLCSASKLIHDVRVGGNGLQHYQLSSISYCPLDFRRYFLVQLLEEG